MAGEGWGPEVLVLEGVYTCTDICVENMWWALGNMQRDC